MLKQMLKIFLVFILLVGFDLHAQGPKAAEVMDSDSTAAAISGSQVFSNAQKSDRLERAFSESKPQIVWSVSAAKVFWAVLIMVIAYLVIRYTSLLLEGFAERWTHTRMAIKSLIPIIRIFGWSLVLYFVIAEIFEPPIETLVAVTASAGIAIGFASQDILKNIFGGILILFDRPFQVGDKIQVGSYYGEVKSIGLRTVRIVTPDDSLVSIPNSEIVNQSVSNANSGESNCQVVAQVYLPIDLPMERVKKIAYMSAAVSRYVYLKKPIAIVIKNEINEGRLVYLLRLKAYVFDIRCEFAFMSDLTETVISELLKEKILSLAEIKELNPGLKGK